MPGRGAVGGEQHREQHEADRGQVRNRRMLLDPNRAQRKARRTRAPGRAARPRPGCRSASPEDERRADQEGSVSPQCSHLSPARPASFRPGAPSPACRRVQGPRAPFAQTTAHGLRRRSLAGLRRACASPRPSRADQDHAREVSRRAITARASRKTRTARWEPRQRALPACAATAAGRGRRIGADAGLTPCSTGPTIADPHHSCVSMV